MIVPLFALANLGIHIDGELLGDAAILADHARDHLRLRPRQADRDHARPPGSPRARGCSGLRLALSWPAIIGGGVVAGIGFTVSLLIASNAFSGQELDEAKLGILGAAIISALLSWVIFRVIIPRLPASIRVRQPASATDIAARPLRRRRP